MKRRVFCLGAGATMVALPIGCGGGTPNVGGDDLATGGATDMGPSSGSCGSINGGTAANIAMGTAHFLSSDEVFVCRDAGGLFALTSVCTHQGCDVDFVSAGAGFHCPCHGATYSFDGVVTLGPARNPLVHYELCVDATGNITVDSSTTVDSKTRTAG